MFLARALQRGLRACATWTVLRHECACSIVGGGLSGLATAFYLQQQPELRQANIRLIEARQKLGGSYVSTFHANAGQLYALFHSAEKSSNDHGSDAHNVSNGFRSVSQKIGSLARQEVEHRLLSRHTSVTPAALQGSDTLGSLSSDARSRPFKHEEGKIPLEFGAGVPHILSPGGSHILKLIQQLLEPSQLDIARKHSASLFSLLNSSKRLVVGKHWSAFLKTQTPFASRVPALCQPGLSRISIVQALIAGIRESCMRRRVATSEIMSKEKSCSTQVPPGEDTYRAPKDMSVSSFAELHSSTAITNNLLLPAFSACSYAGQ